MNNHKNIYGNEKPPESTKTKDSSGLYLSMGYEKDGFAFLIDGFELSKSFCWKKGMSAPPYDSNHKAGRYLTIAFYTALYNQKRRMCTHFDEIIDVFPSPWL